MLPPPCLSSRVSRLHRAGYRPRSTLVAAPRAGSHSAHPRSRSRDALKYNPLRGESPISTALEVANAIPGVNFVSAPVTLAYGLGKIALGGFEQSVTALCGHPLMRAGQLTMQNGVKAVLLGAAGLVPGLGAVPNLVAAAREPNGANGDFI